MAIVKNSGAPPFTFKVASPSGVTIVGSAGNDTINASKTVTGQPLPTDDGDLIHGHGGIDFINALGGNDMVAGGAGGDALNGGDGIDTASYEGSAAPLVVNLATGTGTGGDAAGDKLSNFENVIGGDTGDKLTGNGGANELYGSGGDDILAGGAGADTLDGGAGNDTASYAADTAGVTVSLATGVVSGGHAQGDTLILIENLAGGAGNDTI